MCFHRFGCVMVLFGCLCDVVVSCFSFSLEFLVSICFVARVGGWFHVLFPSSHFLEAFRV
eukprot:TRINITY_DN1608_c0_g1_i1.p5 TRINITY_DN1608_c0_g1~~TRINITY_DN1608_c0_g1_i1.p5  ORF type:complete len:60 (-),score=4.91 TRINITY_DN1608_c0_g1_i1:103-282(-)